MIKRIALLLTIFILGLSSPVLAAEPGDGIINGQMINGTEGAGIVAGQDVTLKINLNNAEADSITTQTDAEGRFTFDGLSTEPGYTYQINTKYQEAEYPGEWLNFDDGVLEKSVEFTVYESTTDDSVVKISMAHAIIYPEEGALRIMEYYYFTNDTDRTYIGTKELADNPGTWESLDFSLPGGAEDLYPEYGLMECCIYPTAGGFIDSMPVMPGNREIIFSYLVKNKSGAFNLSQTIHYPLGNYNLLVQGGGAKVNSDRLIAGEPLDINGTIFSHFSGSDFSRGETLVAQITGLPQPGNQQAALWIILTLVVLTGGFSLSRLLKKRQLQPVPAGDTLEQRRERLLGELARLDDDFDSGKINEAAYRKLRAERKSQLVKLLRRPEGNIGHR
ncbi:MAG: carboxypeptidase-like regulatory domain-containing protein [Dehalococcoidales bacterium]|nr:carboxypeptidase-like regulatory domain-containing protein [Dehalococcoidales bacterium]